MNDNISNRYLSKGCLTALCVLRTVGAVLLVTVMILLFASGAASISYGILGGLSSGVMAVGSMLLSLLPLLALIGMGIAWAVAMSRSSSPYSDGSLLRSTAAASLSLSVVGFIAVLGFFLILIGAVGALRSSATVSNAVLTSDKTISVISVILTGVGTAALLPTCISRTVFYRSVSRTLSGSASSYKGAAMYAAMKLINAVVKIGFGLLMIVTLIQNSALGAFLMICIAVAFFVGAAANIVEAKLAFDYKKAVVPNGGAPGGYYPSGYADPSYYAPAPDYYAPAYPPQQPAYPAEQPTVSDVPRCPDCGAAIEGNYAFCNNCGCKLP